MAKKMFLITNEEMDEYKRLKEQENVVRYGITKEEWVEYRRLKIKNTKKCKYMGYDHLMHCPVCGYVVDHKVPTQTYCDRCGQRLED